MKQEAPDDKDRPDEAENRLLVTAFYSLTCYGASERGAMDALQQSPD